MLIDESQHDKRLQQSDKVTHAERRQDMLMKAIQMRLNGSRYEIIANNLHDAGFIVAEQTIRTWFMHGGECHDVYESLRTQRIKELEQNIAAVSEQLKEGAVDAIALLKNGMLTGKITGQQERIAQDILDRAGYPKTNKTEGSVKVDDGGAMGEVAKALRGILEK